LNLKGKNFLNLLNNTFLDIEPTYTKGGPWIENFSFSNSLCAWATWAITNYTPIGEYYLRFFLKEEFSYPCGDYPIETRCHILYDCRGFNKYWNLRRDTISQFISFLEFNLNAFSKEKSITWVCNSIATVFYYFCVFSFLFFSFYFYFLFLLSPI